MASSINASVTSNGIIQSADASGILQLQSNGTTGLSVNSGGKVVYANTALTTASAGTFEYDGDVPYFTPQGLERGVVPGMQYYRLNSTLLGANVTTAQSFLGVGVTLSSSTVYEFQAMIALSKTAGTTSNNFGLLYGGTATLNNIGYFAQFKYNSSFSAVPTTDSYSIFANVATSSTILTGIAAAAGNMVLNIRGTVSINSGGTFIPQYILSAAPGGAWTTAIGSYFRIYPIGIAGSNTNVGTWA